MSYYIYSDEALPNEKFIGKFGHTPEWIRWQGVQLCVPEKQWTRIPDSWRILRHRDSSDRAGHEDIVLASDIMPVINAQWGPRGVIVIDHSPSDDEKAQIEKDAEARNRLFRMGVIEAFEAAVREREITGRGRSKPTAYEDECYSMLNIPKPYSHDVLIAQRQPGVHVGDEIARSLERLLATRQTGEKPAIARTK